MKFNISLFFALKAQVQNSVKTAMEDSFPPGQQAIRQPDDHSGGDEVGILEKLACPNVPFGTGGP
ncbi:MAG: hypothetical protein MRK02_01105 [Candidatus Scalindua sp.]|nr:hypothetical protein [Candidatus Scalindua sp.]